MNPQNTTPPQPADQPPSFSPDGQPANSFQQPATADQPITNPYQPAAPQQPSSKKWIFWLVLWLGALPLSITISVIARFIFARTNDVSAASVPAELNIITLLLGLYAFVGWIPMLVSILRKRQ